MENILEHNFHVYLETSHCCSTSNAVDIEAGYGPPSSKCRRVNMVSSEMTNCFSEEGKKSGD